MLTSGHPPETRTRVLTYGHLPGPLTHDIVFWEEGLQASFGTAGMETVEKQWRIGTSNAKVGGQGLLE